MKEAGGRAGARAVQPVAAATGRRPVSGVGERAAAAGQPAARGGEREEGRRPASGDTHAADKGGGGGRGGLARRQRWPAGVDERGQEHRAPCRAVACLLRSSHQIYGWVVVG